MRTLTTALALLTLAAAPAAAQSAVLAAGGTLMDFAGDDYANAGPGLGLEIAGRYRLPSGVELGGALETGGYTSTDPASGIGADIDVLGAFGEVRAPVRVTGQVSPYVGVRAGWIRQSASVLGFSADASGWLAAAIGGVTMPLGDVLTADIGALAGHASFGSGTVGGELGGGPGGGSVRVDRAERVCVADRIARAGADGLGEGWAFVMTRHAMRLAISLEVPGKADGHGGGQRDGWVA